MKLFGALCLCLLCPGVWSAQTISNNSVHPEVLILKYSRLFKTERYLPHNWENLPESYPRRPYPMPGDGSLPSTEAPMKRMKRRPLFVYTVEIKNTETKKIAAVVWEYVIIDTGNDNEFARLQFVNRAKVAVNGTAILNGRSLVPPFFPKVINVQELEKAADTPYRESVEIKCVLYVDGTWWKDPRVIESDCERRVSEKRRQGSKGL
jgi:hypothetical protein